VKTVAILVKNALLTVLIVLNVLKDTIFI